MIHTSLKFTKQGFLTSLLALIIIMNMGDANITEKIKESVYP